MRHQLNGKLVGALGLLTCTALFCGCGTSSLTDAGNAAAPNSPVRLTSATNSNNLALPTATDRSACCAKQDSQTCPSTSQCTSCDVGAIDASAKPSLTIRWKRRVEGENGDSVRAHWTAEKEVDAAFAMLKSSLQPAGIDVVLQKVPLTEEQFAKDPLKSNRLWLNGASLEMYLPEAKAGSVQSPDSTTVYRTVEFAGASFRDVPRQMIVKAGLIAAADAVKQSLEDVQAVGLSASGNSSCCATGSTASACCNTAGTKSACCKTGSSGATACADSSCAKPGK